MAAKISASTDTYDVVPYISLPISYTQPARLAALGQIFGLKVPDAATARVLELGCASGGNIVPLAVRYPEARFQGIDLSARQIGDGKRFLSTLGLANIELVQGDLSAVSAKKGTFDFIICHGVMSWVAPSLQDAILRICRECLSQNGLAVISYNVLPGWHVRSLVRDICLAAARGTDSPMEQAARARTALGEIAKGIRGDPDAYGLAVKSEAARLAKLPSSYILGEYLCEHNTPLRFGEFVERAHRAGLTYVCEGDLPSSIPSTLTGKASTIAQSLGALDGADQRIAEEDAADIVSGRTFRRSIFVKSGAKIKPRFGSSSERVAGLHFSAPLQYAEQQSSKGRFAFIDHKGQTFTANNEGLKRALAALGAVYPASLSLDEITSLAAGSIAPNGKGRADIAAAMLKLAAQGRTTLSTLPLECGRANAPKPKLWPLAAAELAAGQPWMSTLRHTAIFAPEVLREISPKLNGKTDKPALSNVLATAAKRIKPIPSDQPAAGHGALASAPALAGPPQEQLDALLTYLERNGALAP